MSESERIEIDVLKALRNAKLQGSHIPSGSFKEEIENKWGIKKTKFYDIIGHLRDDEFIKNETETEGMSYYSITAQGEERLRELETARIPIEVERRDSLKECAIGKLNSVIEDVNRIAEGWKVFLSVGRQAVWNSLASLYSRANDNLSLLGEGLTFWLPQSRMNMKAQD